jgi:hypothetical protein
MIEIKKLCTGFFKVYVDGVDSVYTIRIANGFGGGAGKAFYDVYKETNRVNLPMVKLSLAKAKELVAKELSK